MLEGEGGFFPKGRAGKLEGKEGGVAVLLMGRTIQAVTRPLYAAGATEWLGLNGPHRAEFCWHPGLRQHKICLPNPGCGTRKKLFYQGEDLGWLALNIHTHKSPNIHPAKGCTRHPPNLQTNRVLSNLRGEKSLVLLNCSFWYKFTIFFLKAIPNYHRRFCDDCPTGCFTF